jgi:hypothetical protein
MQMSNRKKEVNNGTNGHGARVKLRWMELDVEGGTPDLVEGFKSFANALTRGGTTAAPARTLAAANPVSNTSTAVLEPLNTEDPKPMEVATTEIAEDLSCETISANQPDPPKRRAAPKAPKFLSDLDLTKAPVQLTDFVGEKNPDGDMDRFAVIATWFKQQLNTEEVTIDHIFTAYKALGWQAQLPGDLSTTFGNLKHSKNWFGSGSKRGAYKINWNGESAVNKMGAVNQ